MPHNETANTMPANANNRRRLSKILITMFVLAVFMGTGPGVLLVNRATVVLGVPLIYAWAVLWYTVQSVAVLLAYLFVWRPEHSAVDVPER